jgi:hypothetical protein
MRTSSSLQSLDRYHSRKNRVRKEHFGTVILQICRTHWRPNSYRWSGHLKNWVDRSSQPLDHYSAYVDSFRPDFLCQGSPDCLEDPTILSGSLRSTLGVFEEYQDAEIVSYMPRCLMLPSMMMILTVYISMKHFVVSISSHPVTPLLKRLTWSMPIFSVTWTRLYQKEAITFPQGQSFANQNLGLSFSWHLVLYSEKQLLCMARAILKKVESSGYGWGTPPYYLCLTSLSPILTK